MWTALRKTDRHIVGTRTSPQFAKMLEELFSGIVTEPIKPDTFTEQMFEPNQLKAASGRI